MAKADSIPEEIEVPAPVVSEVDCLATASTDPFTAYARSDEAVGTASLELLQAIARASVRLVAVGVPSVTTEQREAVAALHVLLFGS